MTSTVCQQILVRAFIYEHTLDDADIVTPVDKGILCKLMYTSND